MIAQIFGWWLGISFAAALGWYVARNPKPRCEDDELTCMSCGASGYSRRWCNALDCRKDAAL